MSAMLCAAAGAAEDVWVVDGAAEEVASFVAVELLHAPRAATAASAAIPVTTVLVLFTTCLSSVVTLVRLPASRVWIGVS